MARLGQQPCSTSGMNIMYVRYLWSTELMGVAEAGSNFMEGFDFDGLLLVFFTWGVNS